MEFALKQDGVQLFLVIILAQYQAIYRPRSSIIANKRDKNTSQYLCIIKFLLIDFFSPRLDLLTRNFILESIYTKSIESPILFPALIE